MKSIKDKPKILIVDNSIAITGALKSIVNSASYLREEYEFIFVIPKGSLAIDFIRANSFHAYELPFVEIGKSFKKLFLYFPFLILNSFKIKKIVKDQDIKVIHMNDFYNLTGIGAVILGTSAVLVTHVRFLPNKFMPLLSKIWAKLNLIFSERILCVSEAVRDFFPDSEKVSILYDSVPESEVHPEKKVVDTPSQIVKLLYLSNFILGKGHNYALRAFEIAYKENSNIRLLFVGGDMGLEKNRIYRNKLENEVREKQLDSVVSFSSFVTDVEFLIKSSDIVLNFSESESFSLTCLDSLYYGTPLIASDSGGPAELFEDSLSGYLVPNRDVTAMADAIIDLAFDLDKRKTFSYCGKVYVRNKFSLRDNSAKLSAIYRSYLRK